MLKRLGKKGQSALEYAMLAVIVIGAMIGIQNYFKRGIQGRYKASVDGVGDQYDPMQTSSDLQHSISGTTVTNITRADLGAGQETFRSDSATITETKTGTTRVDAQ